MRNLKFAMLALLAASAATMTVPTPAAAYDYPWCVMGGELGYSGDCMYETQAQCLASASGRWNLYCSINPRVAFGRQQQPQFEPQPQRRGRHYRRHHDE
jgi:invasion protein IalB